MTEPTGCTAVPMSSGILKVIHAVQDHSRALASDADAMGRRQGAKWREEQTMDYFRKLPMPDGMKCDRETFRKAMDMSRSVLDALDREDPALLGRITFVEYDDG